MLRLDLKPLFENPNIGFYGHNLKYDYHVLLNDGIAIANIAFDTIMASYFLNSHSRQHSLDHLSLEIFGKGQNLHSRVDRKREKSNQHAEVLP